MAVNAGTVTHHDWVVTCGTDQRENATASNVTHFKQIGLPLNFSSVSSVQSVVLLCGSISTYLYIYIYKHERLMCCMVGQEGVVAAA